MRENDKRKTILFSAHEISPNLGSECSSGWNIVLLLSKIHNVTVVFAKTNQFGSQDYEQQIKNYFEHHDLPSGLIFVPVAQPFLGRIISSVNKIISNSSSGTGNSFLYFASYKEWQKAAYKKARMLIEKQSYDIVHHFNSLSYREPGFLYKLNIPFVWGPTSGLDNLPHGFLKNVPMRMRIKIILRNISNNIQLSLSQRVREALNKAEIIYTVTAADKAKLSKFNNNVVNLLDVGASVHQNNCNFRVYNGQRKLNILWVGRLDYLKALDILIYAVSKSESLKNMLNITIAGDGPQSEYYKQIVQEYKLTNFVWLGQVNKERVAILMNNSDLLVHTSIKEAASAVILESLSTGLPVICHDSFGMSHSITKSCGIKIPFISMESSVLGFQNALEDILTHPDMINKLSYGAYSRARELTWDNMAHVISNGYSRILSSDENLSTNSPLFQ